MSTNGVNGANGPKTAADFKPEELQNAKQEKVKNTIFELDEAIAADVDQMYADNEIDSTEMNRIYDWVHVIDNMIGNMSAQVKQSCSDGLQILKDWVAELIDTSGMGKYNGQNVQYDGKTVTETSQTEQTVLEPAQKDSDSEYRTMVQHTKADERLDRYKQDIRNYRINRNSDVAIHGYSYSSDGGEDSITNYAAQDIAEIFLGRQNRKSDAQNLKNWAEYQHQKNNIDYTLYSKLVKHADKIIDRQETDARQPQQAADSGELSGVEIDPEEVIAQVHRDTPVGGRYDNP